VLRPHSLRGYPPVTTMSGVMLDNTLVATLSTGLPSGLGVYLARVNRDWSARGQAT
jgi:hypothetical protein